MTTDPESFESEPLDYGKGLAWTMGFNALMKIVSTVVGIYVTRKLGPMEMGIFGLLGSIYVLAEQMREAGLKQAFYNDNDVTPIRFRTYARLSVLSGLTFGLILALLSHPLANFFLMPQAATAIIWAAFASFLNGVSVIPIASLHKSGRFRDVGLIDTTSNLISIGVALGLVLAGWGFEALVAQLVVRALVQFLIAFWQKPFSILHHDRKAARQIMRVCTPLVATDLLWLLYSLADQFAIVRILGTRFGDIVGSTANGFYERGRKIVGIPSDFIFFPLLRTVTVAIGNRATDSKELARTFMKAICLAVLLLASIFGVVAALDRPLVLAVYTDKFAGTIPVLGIICIGEAFKLTGTFAGSALVAAGKSKIPMFAWLLPYPIAALGILVSWHDISLIKIVWSYTAGMIAVNIIVIAAGFKFLNVDRAQILRFWECVGIASTTAMIAYAFSFLPLRPWPLVILAGVTLPIIHASIIGMVFARNPLAYLSISGAKRLREAL